MKEQAILKFNDGAGALLCSGCSRIISTGNNFTEKEWMAMRGKLELPAQYCKDCREVSKNGNNETVTNGHDLTAVDWLIKQLEELLYSSTFERLEEEFKQAKAMEKKQRIKDYNSGFDDAKCNHINDAENYFSDSVCINEGKATDDFIIGPFGVPEKK